MDQRQHPIEQIMETTLENLKQMIDVNTIVGDSMVMADGTMIVPVSKVNLGFVSGGGEYPDKTKAGGKGAQPQEPQQEGKDKLPFAGGAGAGVSVQPIGFLVTGPDQIRLLPAQPYAPVDRIIELVPQTLCEIKNALCACMDKKNACKQPTEPPQP